MAKAGTAILGALLCLAAQRLVAEPRLGDAGYLGISGGWVATANDDLRALLPSSIVPEQWGSLGMIKLGFVSESGFWIEGAFRHGPSRQFVEKSLQGAYSFNESTFSIEPGHRTALGARATLGVGMAMGISSQSFSFRDASTSQAFTGSSFSFSPEARLSLVFNLIGVDLDLGYHISNSSAMKDETGAPLVTTSLATGEPTAWRMENSGFFFRLGLVYYFSTPLPAPKKRV